MKKTVLALPIAMIGLISCNDTVNKTRTCIVEASNNAMIEGNKLSDDDLIGLCVESKEKLKQLSLADKTAIVSTLDSALNKISVKELFPEANQREFAAISSSKEIESILSTYQNRYKNDQIVLDKAQYYFFKRPIREGKFLVERLVKNLATEEIIVKDHKVEVTGKLIEGFDINNNLQVRLKMPVEVITKIKQSTSDLSGIDTHNQVMLFSGICTDFGLTLGDKYSVTFDVDNYKLIDMQPPAPKVDTASVDVLPDESVSENSTDTVNIQ